MADYYPLISRAVAALEKNNGENRRAIYERARHALLAQLRGVTPALEESDITRERLALAFEPDSLFERTAREPDATRLLLRTAAAHFGAEPSLAFEPLANGKGGVTVSQIENRERTERQRAALARAKEHPRIADAARILGAKLKEIRLPED